MNPAWLITFTDDSTLLVPVTEFFEIHPNGWVSVGTTSYSPAAIFRIQPVKE